MLHSFGWESERWHRGLAAADGGFHRNCRVMPVSPALKRCSRCCEGPAGRPGASSGSCSKPFLTYMALKDSQGLLYLGVALPGARSRPAVGFGMEIRRFIKEM